MRKLKLLLMTLTLLVGGVLSASAYTVDDLTAAGWTKITTSSISGVADNYYMLVDANSSAYVMSNDATHFRPCYKTLADPVANPSFVWILEGSDNSFNLKSFSTGAYFKQASGWNTAMGYAREDRTKITCLFTLSGEKYTAKCVETNNFIGHWNDDGASVKEDGESVAANKGEANAPGFYLYAIPRSQFIAALSASRFTTVSTATKASPVDVTSYIQNADWSSDWGGWESTFTSSGNMQWGQQTLESWNANNVVIKQELKGVPNGCYKLTADVISGPGATKAAYVYATGDSKVSSDVVSAEASANNYNTMSSEVAGKTLTADNVNVTGNAITVGIDQSTGWIVADNFKLYYYGPNLAANAVALPVGGAMTANTWYYIDVLSDSEYDLTATTLDDIVYTTDGSILVEDQATVTVNFSSTNPVALTAGRYYIKSSSDNNFAFEAHTKIYSVGDFTATSIADNTYLQTLTTVTFTLGDAATNDLTAALALQGTPVTKLNDGTSDIADGALSISGNVVTATYTSVALDPAKTYTITLPADAVAWDKNTENKNAEKVITFKTPALFDNTYFIATTDGTQFISRGGNSNTEAILDEFGIAATFTTDANNVTTIKFVDNNKHLAGGSNSVYNDKTRAELETEEAGKGERANWTITANADGYNIYSTKWNKYIGKGEGAEAPYYPTVATYVDAAYKWMLVTPAAHATTVAAYKDANAAAVATAAYAAGITAVAGKTTVAALKAVIEGAGWVGKNIDVTDAITSVQEKYQFADSETPVSESLTGLENGIYKVKLSVFKRIADNNTTYDLYSKNQDSPTAYLFAGDNKAQVPSVMSEYSTEVYTGGYGPNYSPESGKNYPNNTTNAGQAFDAGRYTLEVFAYVSDGTLNIGLKNPAKYFNSNWLCYRDLEVTLYKEFTGDYTDLASAISTAESTHTLGFENGEYAPYNNVAALTALAAAKTLNTNQDATTQTEIDNATTALTSATWTANNADVDAIYNGNFSSAEDWGLTGWTRTNSWGQQRDDVDNTSASTTYGYYNQPGSLQYGNAGVYTMPLKANTVYQLSFKYASWENNSNNGVTVSVLKGDDGMAALVFEKNGKIYKETGAFVTKTFVFATGAAGNYVLTLANSGNTVMTDVSITKAASQVLEFADGSVPTYAPGTYPSVKITRTLTANRWATAVYPFALSTDDVNNIAVLGSYTASTGELNFSSATSSEANVPFLMRSTAGATVINLSNVAVAATAAEPEATASEVSLKGTYSQIEIDDTEKNYVLSNNVIYEVGSAKATITPYRAYFQVDQSVAPEARLQSFAVDGEATAIEGIAMGKKIGNGNVYNLKGQKMNGKLGKDIYVIDGKKAVIK